MKLGGFLWRFLLAAVLLLATYNPEGKSYTHWIREGGFTPLKVFVGVCLLIGWVFFLGATMRSLGVLGTALAAAFFGALIWLLITWLKLDAQGKGLAYLILLSVAAVLATGSAWSLFRRKVTGQVDVDETHG